ncbi:MAG: DUF1622 domain-containing protein [Candidatus Margulisbacteria bacterium]|nr:DUF1622 domain-containing protein [Candidatus Margulisiibacteriota bacterium]
MIEIFHGLIGWISFSLNIIGALITIWGILLSLLEFLGKEIFNRKKAIELNESIRLRLGSYLVLSLEFFIASDIIKTVITPTWEGLGILGAIVAVRTVLSYFLTKELEKKH